MYDWMDGRIFVLFLVWRTPLSRLSVGDVDVHAPFKQCTTTSNFPSTSSASNSSVQMLFESKAEKDLTWFSSAMVLTTCGTYSYFSGDPAAAVASLSCWMIESTWAMASCERRVPMLIFVRVPFVVVALLPGSVGEDGAAISFLRTP